MPPEDSVSVKMGVSLNLFVLGLFNKNEGMGVVGGWQLLIDNCEGARWVVHPIYPAPCALGRPPGIGPLPLQNRLYFSYTLTPRG